MFCGRDLWWTIPLHIFHWSCWDTLWIPNDHMDLCQTHCVQVPDFSRHWGHMVNQLPIKIGSFQFLPMGLHGLCFGCCFSDPLPLCSLKDGPPIRVRYTQKLTRSTLALKLSVSPPYYPWVTATVHILTLRLLMAAKNLLPAVRDEIDIRGKFLSYLSGILKIEIPPDFWFHP